MKSNGLVSLALGTTLGLCSGFIIANNAQRLSENRIYKLSSQSAEAQGATAETPGNSLQSNELLTESKTLAVDLTVKELDQAILTADQEQTNLPLQRNLGIALFKYAVIEQKTDLLPSVVKLLERAEVKSSAADFELHQTLGDAQFILGKSNQPEKMLLARAAYRKALSLEPKNVDLIINLGLTFFYGQPSNLSAAIEQYNQALKLQPSNQKGLENLIAALIASRQTIEARQTLEKLQKINPQSLALNDFQIQINQQTLEVRHTLK